MEQNQLLENGGSKEESDGHKFRDSNPQPTGKYEDTPVRDSSLGLEKMAKTAGLSK